MSRKLADDCFAGDGGRLTHAEALAILRDRLTCTVGTEIVPIGEAAGRIAGADLKASADIPPAANAAVDGFAFAHADYLAAKGCLPVSARIAAGHPPQSPLAPGTAARIFTGALIPEGADTVAMQEDCVAKAGAVRIPEGLKTGANRRRAGEDIRRGDALIAGGLRLRPQDIAAAASLGIASLECRAKLRVCLFSSGDELRRPGDSAGPGNVYDSNHFLLSGLLENLPVTVRDGGILPDRRDKVDAALAEAANAADIVICSGGASMGEEDHFVASLGSVGHRHMWQIAIKPGRPMCFGQIGDCVALGLPGNPVAAFICFLLYARPAILRLAGADWTDPPRFMVPASFSVGAKKTGRREFYRGRLVRIPDGTMRAEKFERDGSGLITSLREADGLIEVPEQATSVREGELVAFIPFASLGVAN
ncbi:MAG: molybdopterin molybdotransferase MoeA [Rhodobiaceae bacterium]|nr:molybdopterin molybdotransferase MoeA [Rhodobiaceae bacterium]